MYVLEVKGVNFQNGSNDGILKDLSKIIIPSPLCAKTITHILQLSQKAQKKSKY